VTNDLFGNRPSLADLAWFGQLSETAAVDCDGIVL
jgi:hypothetical protein